MLEDSITTYSDDTRRTKHQSLATIVTDQIEDWIMVGTLKAGERINVDELAEKLKVSRMPVRDAIKSLERSGLVEVVPYQGTKVTTLKLEDLKEIYLLRQLLEPTAAMFATQRITDDEILRIESVQFYLEKVIRMEGNVDRKTVYKLNREFHFQIYQASRMPRLCSFIGILWNNIAYYRMVVVTNKHYGEKMEREHRSYLNALIARDGEQLGYLINHFLQAHLEAMPEELRIYKEAINSPQVNVLPNSGRSEDQISIPGENS